MNIGALRVQSHDEHKDGTEKGELTLLPEACNLVGTSNENEGKMKHLRKKTQTNTNSPSLGMS